MARPTWTCLHVVRKSNHCVSSHSIGLMDFMKISKNRYLCKMYNESGYMGLGSRISTSVKPAVSDLLYLGCFSSYMPWNPKVHNRRGCIILHRPNAQYINTACGENEDLIQASSGTSSNNVSEQPQTTRQRLGKRKVAMHIGYKGSGYRGLQKQKVSAPKETIEDELEAAIFAVGGILPSNMGDLTKLRWSRSSRTDKSVHSLSTVVSLKLECDPNSFEQDPENMELVKGINMHLPASIRVFSVQRVTKSFEARRDCTRRSYHYYLPASFLGVNGCEEEKDVKILNKLNKAWKCFEGFRAFHNYTRRRLYRNPTSSFGTGNEDESMSDRFSSSSDEEETRQKEANIIVKKRLATTGYDGDKEMKDTNRGKLKLGFKGEVDPSDPIVRRHFRYVEQCDTDLHLRTIVKDGIPCIRLSVRGDSFMLHQIRHMVGTAVAVALDLIPFDVIPASMAKAARINLPLAPPSTLVLSDAEFSKFRSSWDGKTSKTVASSGARLDLKAGGQVLKEQFAQDVLFPAVNDLLESDEWNAWKENLTEIWYNETEMEQWLDSIQSWYSERPIATEKP